MRETLGGLANFTYQEVRMRKPKLKFTPKEWEAIEVALRLMLLSATSYPLDKYAKRALEKLEGR